MPQVNGTFSTYDAVGNRESLEDAIYRITPEETPFISMIGTESVDAVRHDWQLDKLGTPSNNKQIEGAEYEFENRDPTKRVANFTQISSKPVIVSETQDAVKKAGRKTELGYQLAKAGVELRQDIEYAALSNQGSIAGDDDTPRQSAGFPAWIETNSVRGSGGADGGFDINTGLVAAAVDGGFASQWDRYQLDDAIQMTYISGGNPKTIMVSPSNKRRFSTFMTEQGVVELRRQVPDSKKQATLLAAADIYQSDFGELAVVPNRIMATDPIIARNVLIIDPTKVTRGVLRPMKHDVPAKTGDANKRVIKTEWTLIVRNEAAHGIIADTEGSI